MARRDYGPIAEEYIGGWASLRALSEKYKIPWSTLRDRARREGWEYRRLERRAAQRGETVGETEADGCEAERIFRVTDKLMRRAEEILDGGDEVGARELGELMRAVKNAKEIRMLRSALDEREQLARVRSLEEKAAPAARESLCIEFSAEVEEAAQ